MADPEIPAPRNAQRGLIRVALPRRKPKERTKAGTQDSRVHNRSLILATLYRHGTMSRSDLTRASGLTAPTVSAVVADLETDGLIADIGPREGVRRGKPASLVEIDHDGNNIVVLDLSHNDWFSGAVLNLRGEIVARAEVRLEGALGDKAHELVLALASDLIARAPNRVLGIGVGSPGIIDDSGVVRDAAHLGWADLPLAGELTKAFGVAAYVGNDANVAALAVRHFRRRQESDLMVILTEHGVGAGLIVGGEVVTGEQFAGGEIGHVTVDEDGEPCVCGRSGCLDQIVAAEGLRRRLASAPEADHPALLAASGRALGIVLAPILSALNLNEVVLTGPPDLIEGPFVDSAERTARARTLSPISASLRIRSLAGDDNLILLGAGCLVLTGQLGVL